MVHFVTSSSLISLFVHTLVHYTVILDSILITCTVYGRSGFEFALPQQCSAAVFIGPLCTEVLCNTWNLNNDNYITLLIYSQYWWTKLNTVLAYYRIWCQKKLGAILPGVEHDRVRSGKTAPNKIKNSVGTPPPKKMGVQNNFITVYVWHQFQCTL